jgi:predicted NAD-dependent protein-ADP-ribosyltransferase YbiA (DUF1768 family)
VDCGFQDRPLDDAPTFTPTYYIITAYGDKHYRLVSYKGKKLLRFAELPYYLTEMIRMKCMENNAGLFATIPEFKERNRPPDLVVPPAALDVDHGTVFMFYIRSENRARPGKGSGETIPLHRVPEFHALTKIPHWRRKLDDAWTEHPFVVDDLTYASVAHYMEAAKFRKQYPTLARQFSLVSESPFSKDVKLCQQAATHGVDGEPPVAVDPDFEARRDAEQKKALLGKFTQHADLRDVLLATKNALLTLFVPRRPAVPAVALMEVRQALNEVPV